MEEKKTGAGLNARQRAEREAAEKRKKENKKYCIIGIVVAVFVLAVILLNSGLFTKVLPAVKVGSTDYSLAETRYAYNNSYSNFYNTYNSIISYMLDTSKPLNEQTCSFDESLTWKEYFQQQGDAYLQEITALYDAAVAEGYTLTEEEQEIIENNIASMEVYAQVYGYSTDGFIAAQYGEGNSEKTLREMLGRALIAADYADAKRASFTYNEDELAAWYAENGDDYSSVNYSYVYLDGTGEENMANAKKLADAIEAASDGTLEGFVDAVTAEYGSAPTDSSMSYFSAGEDKDWFTDPARKVGDILRDEQESGIYLYCFKSLDENDYNAVSVRHILVKAVDEDEDGTYSEKEKAAALEAIKAIEAEWDGTEEGFAKLAEEKSEDEGSNTNGGLYENIYKGQMVEEFNDFCFGERTSGDTAIVYGESSVYAGYHLVYFVGEGDTYRNVLAKNALTQSDYSEWIDALIEEKYPLKRTFLYRYA